MDPELGGGGGGGEGGSIFQIAGGGVTLHFFKCTNWGITKGALHLPPPPDNPKLCHFFSSRLEWNTYHPCSHSHLSDFPLLSWCTCVSTPHTRTCTCRVSFRIFGKGGQM